MMLHKCNEIHLDTLLSVMTGFHLCELERIIPTFPVMPNNAISIANSRTMVIRIIEM